MLVYRNKGRFFFRNNNTGHETQMHDLMQPAAPSIQQYCEDEARAAKACFGQLMDGINLKEISTFHAFVYESWLQEVIHPRLLVALHWRQPADWRRIYNESGEICSPF